MDECVLAIDFNHESMKVAFVFPDGRISGEAGFEPNNFSASGDIPQAEKLVALLAKKLKASPAPVKSAIFSIAGELDGGLTTVVSHHGAPWLNGFPLGDAAAAALGLPVLLRRRSLVLLSYDVAMLALPPDALTAACYIDLHYENAVWYRGGPLQGRNQASGNIAHLTIHGREDVCFCGKSGCVDLYGAGIRLRQIHDMIFPDTPIEEIFLRLGDHPILQDYLSMMAYPLAMEANLLDPEFMIIGGGILAMRAFPRQRLEEEIVRQSYVPGGRGTVFLPSATDAAGGLACAGRYAFLRE